MIDIAVIGAGGHTRSSITLVKEHFHNSNIRIYDDSFQQAAHESILSYPLVGALTAIPDDSRVFLSVGNNQSRQVLYEQYQQQLIKENFLHRSAIVEQEVCLGNANQIYAQCYLNSLVQIGHNNIINTAAVLEHEARIGSHNHLSVGSIICGRASVGDHCFIGAGAVVIDRISICSHVFVGAGSVVIGDIQEPGTYVGNPVRKIK